MWVKLLIEHDGKAVGSIHEIEDGEANYLVKSKKAEKAEKPAGVAELASAMRTEAVKQLVAELVPELQKAMLPASKSGQPGLFIGKDNADDDPTDGYKSHGAFAQDVWKVAIGRGESEKLKRIAGKAAAAGASEDVNSAGGYATPVQFATSVYNDIISQQSLSGQCFGIPMTSNTMNLPALNYTQQGQFGVTSFWEGEAATIPTSNPNYRQPKLVLNKLTVLAPVTSELLEDGIAVEATIDYLAGEAITYKINDSIINGTGAGMPTGIVGHPSTVQVNRATNTEVGYPDVTGMRAAFLGTRKNTTWLISQVDVLPQLQTLQDPAGRYLYVAPGNAANADAPEKLMQMPIEPLINCQALGTSGDIILWDPKSYLWGYKSTGINKAMSIHLYFNTDQVAFRWTVRADGRPWRDVQLQAAKSALYYSSCCTLSTGHIS
jgi:HK97 family phage major capsid protein